MRLLKPVDYKLKVHLIINTSSKRENTINLGSESLGAISSWRLKSSIDRLSFLELRHRSKYDPRKRWYVPTKSYCGIKPNAFAKK